MADRRTGGRAVLLLCALTLTLHCGKSLPSSSDDDILEAAAKGDLARVTLLVEEGADVQKAGAKGVTPLHHAALLGDDALAEFLMERGADPAAVTNTNETTLHWAAQGGSEHIIHTLIKAHVDVNARNDENDTALDLAQDTEGVLAGVVAALRAGGGKLGHELDAEGPPTMEVMAPARRRPTE